MRAETEEAIMAVCGMGLPAVNDEISNLSKAEKVAKILT
jgi:hypothetical protein